MSTWSVIDWDEERKATRELLRPEFMFEGSCDFLLGWQLLDAHQQTQAVRENRARFPIQAVAACACMALELALKSLIKLEGTEPERGKAGHNYVVLFRQLSPEAQAEIASRVVLDGKPATVGGVVGALTLCVGTFEKWRYKHEHENLDFHQGYFIEVTRAVHESILRRQPGWRPGAARFFAK